MNPWFLKGLLVSRKQKEILFKNKLKCPSNFNSEKFKQYNDLYVKLYRKAKILYFHDKFKE